MKKTKKPTKSLSSLSKKKVSSRSRRHVRIQLEYVLDLGRKFFEGPYEIAGLKSDVASLIVHGLVYVKSGLRRRYELGNIKLVPSSIKFIAMPCTASGIAKRVDRRGRQRGRQ